MAAVALCDMSAEESYALVVLAQAGDTEAFGKIYNRYVDTVFRFICHRVGNRPLAEDLTSETFLRALKRIGSFTWQGRDLGAWLITIARNLVADHYKSGRYRLEVTTGDILDADREDRDPSPETAAINHIANVAVMAAVKQLNPEQQESASCCGSCKAFRWPTQLRRWAGKQARLRRCNTGRSARWPGSAASRGGGHERQSES